MAMSEMIGEEETQRQREIRVRLKHEERVKSRSEFRRRLSACSRKIIVLLLGVVAVFVILASSPRIQSYASQLGQQLPVPTVTPNPLKQSALKYEDEVNEVIK